MTRLQVEDVENGRHMSRVAVNVLYKQSRTADMAYPPAVGLGVGQTAPHSKKSAYEYFEMLHRASILERNLDLREIKDKIT
jgi:hypothetical protein